MRCEEEEGKGAASRILQVFFPLPLFSMQHGALGGIAHVLGVATQQRALGMLVRRRLPRLPPLGQLGPGHVEEEKEKEKEKEEKDEEVERIKRGEQKTMSGEWVSVKE